MWKKIAVLLIIFTLVGTAQADCTAEIKDEAAGIHAVVETCKDVGVFSIGGTYAGQWKRLTYMYPGAWPGTYITIKVDGRTYSTSHYPNESIQMDNYSVQKPTASGRTITSRWQLPGNIIVEQAIRIIPNGTLLEITTSNNDNKGHDIGARVHIDTMLGDNDGAPIYVPGRGLKTTEETYSGAALNFKYWKAYNNPDNPIIVSTGIIDPAVVSLPDTLKIAYWGKSKLTSWDYLTEGAAIEGDSAVILYFNPTEISPGQKRTVIVSYGNAEPVIEKAFGITEITLDNISGKYAIGGEAAIYVDVASTRGTNEGTILLEVLEAGKVIYSTQKETGQVLEDKMQTLNFPWTIPKEGNFSLSAKLIVNQKQVDEKVKQNMIIVYAPKETNIIWRNLKWLVLALLILAAILVLESRQKVAVTKTKEGETVKVVVENRTRKDVHDCTIEDEIQQNWEVRAKTIGSTRHDRRISWEIGTLKAGKRVVFEYNVKGADIVLPARVFWEGGEAISKQ